MAYRPDRQIILVPTVTIAGAVANVVGSGATTDLVGVRCITVASIFTYGAGGTTCKVWIQTTFDGTTWYDIMNHAFLLAAATKISSVRNITAVAPALVPTSAALGDDLILDGVIGYGLRAMYTTTGTYSGLSSLTVHAVVSGG